AGSGVSAPVKRWWLRPPASRARHTQAAQTASRESTPLRTVQAVWSSIMAAPALLSLKSLSERFDTPVSTLRYHIRTGKLSAVKVGGRVMVPEDEAVAILQPVCQAGKDDAAVKEIVDAARRLTTEQHKQHADTLEVAASAPRRLLWTLAIRPAHLRIRAYRQVKSRKTPGQKCWRQRRMGTPQLPPPPPMGG